MNNTTYGYEDLKENVKKEVKQAYVDAATEGLVEGATELLSQKIKVNPKGIKIDTSDLRKFVEEEINNDLKGIQVNPELKFDRKNGINYKKLVGFNNDDLVTYIENAYDDMQKEENAGSQKFAKQFVASLTLGLQRGLDTMSEYKSSFEFMIDEYNALFEHFQLDDEGNIKVKILDDGTEIKQLSAEAKQLKDIVDDVQELQESIKNVKLKQFFNEIVGNVSNLKKILNDPDFELDIFGNITNSLSDKDYKKYKDKIQQLENDISNGTKTSDEAIKELRKDIDISDVIVEDSKKISALNSVMDSFNSYVNNLRNNKIKDILSTKGIDLSKYENELKRLNSATVNWKKIVDEIVETENKSRNSNNKINLNKVDISKINNVRGNNYWTDEEDGINNISFAVKNLLKQYGLLGKVINNGANNQGGLIGEDSVLLVRQATSSSENLVEETYELKDALDSAYKSGADVSRILNIIEGANGSFIELQSKFSGKEVGKFIDLLSNDTDTNALKEAIDYDYLKLSDEQIKKLISDLKILWDLGYQADLSGGNFAIDSNGKIELFDIGKIDESYKTFEEYVTEEISNFSNNMNDAFDVLGDDNSQKIVNDIESRFNTIAKGIADGSIQLVTVARETTQKAQDSHSPSKIAEKLGGDWGKGYANGILKSKKEVENAIIELIKSGKITTQDLIDDQENINSEVRYKGLAEAANPLINSFNNGTSVNQIISANLVDSMKEFQNEVKNSNSYLEEQNKLISERAALLSNGNIIKEFEQSDETGRVNVGSDLNGVDSIIHSHAYNEKINKLRFSDADIEEIVDGSFKKAILQCGEEFLTLDMSNVKAENFEELKDSILQMYQGVLLSFGAKISNNKIAGLDTLAPKLQNEAVDVINSLMKEIVKSYGGDVYFDKLSEGKLEANDTERIKPMDKTDVNIIKDYIDIASSPNPVRELEKRKELMERLSDSIEEETKREENFEKISTTPPLVDEVPDVEEAAEKIISEIDKVEEKAEELNKQSKNSSPNKLKQLEEEVKQAFPYNPAPVVMLNDSANAIGYGRSDNVDLLEVSQLESIVSNDKDLNQKELNLFIQNYVHTLSEDLLSSIKKVDGHFEDDKIHNFLSEKLEQIIDFSRLDELKELTKPSKEDSYIPEAKDWLNEVLSFYQAIEDFGVTFRSILLESPNKTFNISEIIKSVNNAINIADSRTDSNNKTTTSTTTLIEQNEAIEKEFEEDKAIRDSIEWNTAPVDEMQKHLSDTYEEVRKLHHLLNECFGEGFTDTLARTNFSEIERIDSLVERGLSAEEALEKIKKGYESNSTTSTLVEDQENYQKSLIETSAKVKETAEYIADTWRGVRNESAIGEESSTGNGTFRSTDYKTARGYGNYVEKTKVSLSNPLMIDANNQTWDNIQILGNGIDADSKKAIELATNLTIIFNELKNIIGLSDDLDPLYSKTSSSIMDKLRSAPDLATTEEEKNKIIELRDAYLSADIAYEQFSRDTSHLYGRYTTNQLVSQANSNGFNGVVIDNVFDKGGDDYSKESSTVVVNFLKDQCEYIEKTVDQYGEIITTSISHLNQQSTTPSTPAISDQQVTETVENADKEIDAIEKVEEVKEQISTSTTSIDTEKTTNSLTEIETQLTKIKELAEKKLDYDPFDFSDEADKIQADIDEILQKYPILQKYITDQNDLVYLGGYEEILGKIKEDLKDITNLSKEADLVPEITNSAFYSYMDQNSKKQFTPYASDSLSKSIINQYYKGSKSKDVKADIEKTVRGIGTGKTNENDILNILAKIPSIQKSAENFIDFDSIKSQWDKIREYVSKSKIKLTDDLAGEYGDTEQWNKVRTTIGINTLSKDGLTDVSSFVRELNDLFGTNFNIDSNQEALTDLYEYLSKKPELNREDIQQYFDENGITQGIASLIENAIKTGIKYVDEKGKAYSDTQMDEFEKEFNSTGKISAFESFNEVKKGIAPTNTISTPVEEAPQTEKVVENLANQVSMYEEIAKNTDEIANVKKQEALTDEEDLAILQQIADVQKASAIVDNKTDAIKEETLAEEKLTEAKKEETTISSSDEEPIEQADKYISKLDEIRNRILSLNNLIARETAQSDQIRNLIGYGVGKEVANEQYQKSYANAKEKYTDVDSITTRLTEKINDYQNKSGKISTEDLVKKAAAIKAYIDLYQEIAGENADLSKINMKDAKGNVTDASQILDAINLLFKKLSNENSVNINELNKHNAKILSANEELERIYAENPLLEEEENLKVSLFSLSKAKNLDNKTNAAKVKTVASKYNTYRKNGGELGIESLTSNQRVLKAITPLIEQASNEYKTLLDLFEIKVSSNTIYSFIDAIKKGTISFDYLKDNIADVEDYITKFGAKSAVDFLKFKKNIPDEDFEKFLDLIDNGTITESEFYDNLSRISYYFQQNMGMDEIIGKIHKVDSAVKEVNSDATSTPIVQQNEAIAESVGKASAVEEKLAEVEKKANENGDSSTIKISSSLDEIISKTNRTEEETKILIDEYERLSNVDISKLSDEQVQDLLSNLSFLQDRIEEFNKIDHLSADQLEGNVANIYREQLEKNNNSNEVNLSNESPEIIIKNDDTEKSINEDIKHQAEEYAKIAENIQEINLFRDTGVQTEEDDLRLLQEIADVQSKISSESNPIPTSTPTTVPKSSNKNSNKSSNKDKQSVDEITAAYQKLINTEVEYQTLTNKTNKTVKETVKLSQLTNDRNDALNTLSASVALTEEQTKKQKEYFNLVQITKDAIEQTQKAKEQNTSSKAETKYATEQLTAYQNLNEAYKKAIYAKAEGAEYDKNVISNYNSEEARLRKILEDLKERDVLEKKISAALENQKDLSGGIESNIAKYYSDTKKRGTSGFKDKIDTLNNIYLNPDKNKQGNAYTEQTKTNVKSLIDEMKQLDDYEIVDADSFTKFNKRLDKIIEKYKELMRDQNDINTILADNGQANDFIGKISDNLNKNSAMSKDLQTRFKALREEFQNVIDTKGSQKELNELIGKFKKLDSEMKYAGKTGKNFLAKIKDRITDMNSKFIGQYFSFQDFIRYFQQAVTVVEELDTELTEMRKVSDASLSSLKKYQEATFDIAKEIGTTAVDLQAATADWMRLGESLDEAAESAKEATILMNVSEFDSIDEATESLVAMSQAYDDLSKEDIIDVLNNIGNNYSIATDELATALQTSASALKTQGNDLNEAVALITAGNSVVQDADSVGAGIRTISLRIAGKLYARTYSNVCLENRYIG